MLLSRTVLTLPDACGFKSCDSTVRIKDGRCAQQQYDRVKPLSKHDEGLTTWTDSLSSDMSTDHETRKNYQVCRAFSNCGHETSRVTCCILQAHPADWWRDHDEGVGRVRPDGKIRLVVVSEQEWHVHEVCLRDAMRQTRQCFLRMQAGSALLRLHKHANPTWRVSCAHAAHVI